MHCTTTHEEILTSLVHDLRQPLGNMETSLFYLDMVLHNPSDRVREQLRAMERQMGHAAQLLEGAIDELRALRSQRETDEGAAASANLPFTKAVTAAVT